MTGRIDQDHCGSVVLRGNHLCLWQLLREATTVPVRLRVPRPLYLHWFLEWRSSRNSAVAWVHCFRGLP
ncbi:hypothetical protein LCGC14_1571380 [marine sediment metagenome]|uniref:Uncharacterized protein n=1 Tax=marine sediment metagenome TaxID=412755 RepID=A0A0F9J5T0_9ZZZZ